MLRFHTVFYQAGTWPHPRRVVIKVEVTEKGVNTRVIVTDLLRARAQRLYQGVYCTRGQMENYSPSRQVGIKDHKLGLKSDRTSCHRFLAKEFRLFLHSAAQVLLWALRAEVLGRSSWSRVRFETLRLRLLKLGASVKEEADAIRVSPACAGAGCCRFRVRLPRYCAAVLRGWGPCQNRSVVLVGGLKAGLIQGKGREAVVRLVGVFEP